MASFTCNGWSIFFYPLFNEQWVDLRNRVRVLKNELSKQEFITHSDATVGRSPINPDKPSVKTAFMRLI